MKRFGTYLFFLTLIVHTFSQVVIVGQFFINQDFLTDMVYNGDDLTEPRKVTHWFYFLKDKRRKKFIDKIRTLDFTIDSTNFVKNRNYHYELQVSRKDSVNPASISIRT